MDLFVFIYVLCTICPPWLKKNWFWWYVWDWFFRLKKEEKTWKFDSRFSWTYNISLKSNALNLVAWADWYLSKKKKKKKKKKEKEKDRVSLDFIFLNLNNLLF